MVEGRKPANTARIEAFSDGVIAIVATIMVLELQAPARAFLTGDLMAVVAELGPDISVYALSFLVVAVMLINHHALMRIAPHATTALHWWNANFLFWMTLIPLSTSVYGKDPLTPLAAAFYGAILFANSVSFSLLRRCAIRLNPVASIEEQEGRVFVRKDLIFTAFYGLSIPAAYVSPFISLMIFIIVPAAYFLPDFAPGRR